MRSRNRIRILLGLPLLVALTLSARLAFAQAPTPSDDEVNRIAHQLYCPVCENTPLDVCPTEACRQWRDLIRQQLTQGWSEDRIKQYFVDQYGVRVLAEPPRAGLELAGLRASASHHRGWSNPAPAHHEHVDQTRCAGRHAAGKRAAEG